MRAETSTELENASSEDEVMMIGTFGRLRRIAPHNRSPQSPDTRQSIMTIWGLKSFRTLSARKPFPVARTSYPSSSNINLNAPRASLSSSTTRTRKLGGLATVEPLH